jgi:hypothetical protein
MGVKPHRLRMTAQAAACSALWAAGCFALNAGAAWYIWVPLFAPGVCGLMWMGLDLEG